MSLKSKTEQRPQAIALRRPLVNAVATALVGPGGKGKRRNYRHKYPSEKFCSEAVAGGRNGVEKLSLNWEN